MEYSNPDQVRHFIGRLADHLTKNYVGSKIQEIEGKLVLLVLIDTKANVYLPIVYANQMSPSDLYYVFMSDHGDVLYEETQECLAMEVLFLWYKKLLAEYNYHKPKKVLEFKPKAHCKGSL